MDNILDITRFHEGRPGPNRAGYGVGYLLVKAMFSENPSRTLACITAIQQGKPWETALTQDMGLTRQQLVERLTTRKSP